MSPARSGLSAAGVSLIMIAATHYSPVTRPGERKALHMAKVRQRTWRVPGQRTKRKAWGYVGVDENGKQVRVFKSEWTKEDAEQAMAVFKLKIESKPEAKAPGLRLAQAAERYLTTKARKRSLREDHRILEHLKSAFGAETSLAEITASRISEYKAGRLAARSQRRRDADKNPTPLSAASINRLLALLRHLLRIAHEEWELLPAVPKIKLEKEPEGRIRWLEPDEEARLLAACAKSKTKHLANVVTVALESGLRKGELLGLTWDRVDPSRGVLRLEVTKSGKRREVPMREVVDNILAGLPSKREGRVWPAGDIRTAFEKAVAEAKLEDFHFHDCRHHFASWFVMDGGSLQALQRLLGHATLAMTMRYAHLAPNYIRGEVLKTERRKTERRSEPAAQITQEITQEPVEPVGVSQNSSS